MGVQYARACEARAEFIASEVIRIALGGDKATVMCADGTRIAVLDPNGYASITRLKVDALKW